MNLIQLKHRSAVVTLITVLVLSGCHKKVVPSAPPPPPLPPTPTASITATQGAVQRGQSSTLSWTTTNANHVTINGFGDVPANGSRSVTPTSSTDYTLSAIAPSGMRVQSSTRVTVTLPPIPQPAAPSISQDELFAQNIHDLYFNYDRYDLSGTDASTAEQDASFLKSHPGMKVVIEGHCDDRGSAEYNIALGQNRAAALNKALTTDGVDASRIRIVSYGEEKPFCTEDAESCWHQNRRDHLKLDH